MRAIIISLLVLMTSQINAQLMETIEKITWYGQAAVSIENGEQLIYIDPYQLPAVDKADIILITHSHGDHLSMEDISKIATVETSFVCPHNCKAVLLEAGYEHIFAVSPGDKISIKGTEILAVPMYNIVKANYHPKENLWTGYIVDVDGVKVYHAGDTERIPEMKGLDCDIALLPLGQTYTMNSVEEAAEAALDTGADIAIPIHYGMYEGTKEDALKFIKLLEGKIKVVLMEPIND
jgi:L-ascorbate metabolism protein UlaG (beta-lactamase superfamily)